MSGIVSAGERQPRRLALFVDPEVMNRFRQDSPDAHARLISYCDLADPASDPLVVLPDLSPDDALPVGTTLQTRELLLPYAIGMDPGCGYGCWLLKGALPSVSQKSLQAWVDDWPWPPTNDEISAILPAVFEGRTLSGTAYEELAMLPAVNTAASNPPRLTQLSLRLRNALTKIIVDRSGALATGNHFVELHAMDGAAPETGIAPEDLLLVIHNGSLEAGPLVQKYGMSLAAAQGQKPLTPDHLPFLAIRADSSCGTLYWTWVQWAMRFAAANRTLLASRALAALSRRVGALDVRPLSDLIHSGIARIDRGDEVMWRHQSGTQAVADSTIAYVGGTVGGSSFLIRAAERIADSLGTVSHGSGIDMGTDLPAEEYPVATNLSPTKLAALRRRFRSADRTIRLLQEARLADPVCRTRPLAIVKF